MQKISEVITPHIAVSNTTIQANSIVSNLGIYYLLGNLGKF